MSFLHYNGITINNDGLPGETLGVRRRAVMDGAGNYLRTDCDLRAKGYYNPSLVSYQLGAPNPARPNAVQGQDAVDTDVAIRHRLLQPHCVLAYRVNSKDSLASPLALVFGNNDPDDPTLFYASDVANGPFPLECNIERVVGTKSFWIDFTVRTHINECKAGRFSSPNNQPNVLLSHTWEMASSTDQDHFSTRTIRGRAIFRRDILERFQQPAGAAPVQAMPDDFRSYFVHPVPQSMQRVGIDVNPLMDGCTIDYTVIDRERATNIIATNWPNVTRIEAVSNIGMRSPGWERAAQEGAIFLLDTAETIGAGIEALASPGGAAFAAQLATRLSRSFIELPGRILPRMTGRLSIRVWGNRRSNRRQLADCGYTVLQFIFGAFTRLVAARNEEFSEDLMGKFVSLNCEVEAGPGLTQSILLGNGIVGGAGGTLDLRPFMTPNDAIPQVTSTDPGVANPALPFHNGTRGTFFGRLVAQSLLSSCQNPPRAVDPDAANDYGAAYG
jgi:hypothetical protein